MSTADNNAEQIGHLSLKLHNRKPRVAFVCVHNSCRSQIAEAFARHYAYEVFDAYSAGTEIADRINPDAVRLMKQNFDIDMEAEQYSKSITDLPSVDIVITMGCNVNCPHLPCHYREDWGITDPSGSDDETFHKVIHQIYNKIMALQQRLHVTT